MIDTNEYQNIIDTEIDILENDILEQYPKVLNILLLDRTTQKNIIWGTNNYEHLGEEYHHEKSILLELITGENGNLIMPRVKKDKMLQRSRVKNMAEVFTPSWMCNAQNNSIDNSWFEREHVFNKPLQPPRGNRHWIATTEKVTFPEGKIWMDYVSDTCLEITCGEAPYLTSRYDTTTGEFIAIKQRIGFLDRKLRVVNENTTTSEAWLEAAEIAVKSIYGFEWQGDSLLIARESILFTFIENYSLMFGKKPPQENIEHIAYIISWNLWQMDGLKGVVPYSCKDVIKEEYSLFGNKTKIIPCEGCQCEGIKGIKKHSGIYCWIMNWQELDEETQEKGKKERFIDSLDEEN